MRRIAWVLLVLMMVGCSGDDLSWISIKNKTGVTIYALPYASGITEGGMIEPGAADNFYSIECDCLDGFAYFSFYYDSLIVYLEDHDENPVKFFQDGSTVNYDPTLNPFTNPDVWRTRNLYNHVPTATDETMEGKHIFEHYFSIEAEKVKSLADTVLHELYPDS